MASPRASTADALARAAGKDYVEIGEIVNANVDVAMMDDILGPRMAATPSISVEPMPVPKAPNAPDMQVWESVPTTRAPGWL